MLSWPFSNHRPLFDVSTEDITAAFDKLMTESRMSGDALVGLLMNLGENMSQKEIQASLQVNEVLKLCL